MRFFRYFLLGLFFAGFMMLVSAPFWIAGLAVTAWAKRGELFTALAGESVFGLRETSGRLDGRMVNVAFQMVQVPMAGEPRPRRLLLRIEVFNPDVFSTRAGEGRVRLDAWPPDSVQDVKHPPLYTLVVPGRAATAADDGTLSVEVGGRRAVYGLADGQWLYDADTPPASLGAEGERRRVIALAAAEDDMPATAVAVLTYASSQTVLARVMITAQDPTRARLLRASIGMIRPVARFDDASHRSVELSLPAGPLRIPVEAETLDLTKAVVPQGLGLAELRPWKVPAPKR